MADKSSTPNSVFDLSLWPHEDLLCCTDLTCWDDYGHPYRYRPWATMVALGNLAKQSSTPVRKLKARLIRPAVIHGQHQQTMLGKFRSAEALRSPSDVVNLFQVWARTTTKSILCRYSLHKCDCGFAGCRMRLSPHLLWRRGPHLKHREIC